MPLIPPTYEDYTDFINEEFPSDMIIRIEDMLVQATDAFWVFTGLSDYPSDPQAARVTRYAIMDLTAWLIAQHENRAEINSPFTSERIGSYSYSKMQAAKSDGDSGIYWLDMFFRLMRAVDEGAMLSSVSSENVFNPTGETFLEQETRERIDRFVDSPYFGSGLF